MPGELDLVTVRARRVLLDVLETLREQRHAIILVGAQAIYLHTGDADLAVAPFTQDADLVLNPKTLGSIPVLAEAMQAAGFTQTGQPGIWKSQQEGVTVDLLVPETLGGRPGKRAACLEGHGNNVARQVRGLEAALIDWEIKLISALEDSDVRRMEIMIAGPAALLVAKVHKIAERLHDRRRSQPKDALDVFRLLQAIPSETLSSRFALLHHDPLSLETTQSALTFLQELFSSQTGAGAQLAAEAAYPLADKAFITAACAALTQELMSVLPQDLFEA